MVNNDNDFGRPGEFWPPIVNFSPKQTPSFPLSVCLSHKTLGDKKNHGHLWTKYGQKPCNIVWSGKKITLVIRYRKKIILKCACLKWLLTSFFLSQILQHILHNNEVERMGREEQELSKLPIKGNSTSLTLHSSEKRGLRSTFLSGKTLQNLPYL